MTEQVRVAESPASASRGIAIGIGVTMARARSMVSPPARRALWRRLEMARLCRQRKGKRRRQWIMASRGTSIVTATGIARVAASRVISVRSLVVVAARATAVRETAVAIVASGLIGIGAEVNVHHSSSAPGRPRARDRIRIRRSRR